MREALGGSRNSLDVGSTAPEIPFHPSYQHDSPPIKTMHITPVRHDGRWYCCGFWEDGGDKTILALVVVWKCPGLGSFSPHATNVPGLRGLRRRVLGLVVVVVAVRCV